MLNWWSEAEALRGKLKTTEFCFTQIQNKKNVTGKDP